MASPYLDLLRQIASGISIFEPRGRTGREITLFQDTAQRLLEMERLGLISRTVTEIREIAGIEYLDLVIVTSGLTAEGERLMTAAA